jgi:hypothetical protein
VVAGLLQTSEYARGVLATIQRVATMAGFDGSAAAVPEAVSARVQRQEALADPTKSFHFVMSEAVLSNRTCPPQEMPAQIQRIREVAGQENVSVGFISAETMWTIPPYHGFVVIDDSLVIVDLINTGLTSRGRSDIRLYRQVFDSFEQHVDTDIDVLLDKYLDIYLDLSRPAR